MLWWVTNPYFLNYYSAYDYTVGPMDKAIVKTDIQIAVPHGCYGRVGKFLQNLAACVRACVLLVNSRPILYFPSSAKIWTGRKTLY